MKIKKFCFIAVLIISFALSLCACENKDPNVIPVANKKYDGFTANYTNHNEDVCSTFININSKGEIMYGYDDGCIYKDYDIYERYEYIDGNLIFISDYVDDKIENEVIEWSCEKLILLEDGEEKEFEADYFLYLTDELIEDTYTEIDSNGDAFKTYQFSTSGEVIITNDYSEIDGTYSVLYDAINDTKRVIIEIKDFGSGQYTLDDKNMHIIPEY